MNDDDQRWTPQQAALIVRFLDALSERIWRDFGAAIVRADQAAHDPRQLLLPLSHRNDDIPF